ncbi:succinoglycan biosynthesis transport protein ExoP [Rhizobiales bacterium GAS188]|nr:succinoglycan biosynthesis transport protein ExoP [Rhizobiales bacterium GAS188]
MLQFSKPRLAIEPSLPVSDAVSPAELYAMLAGFVRRQLPVIGFAVAMALLLGTVYLFVTPPKYVGHALLMIDTHKSQFFQQQQPLGDLPIDSATVDTQIEILKSENIALAVVKKLRLDQDPEFTSPSMGLLATLTGSVRRLLPSEPSPPIQPSSDNPLVRSALGTLQGHMSVWRAGLTYAIGIDYQSLNPDRAAQVANAIADAYVDDALEAKYETTRRAGSWLQDRLKELRGQSANAERAVVDFKAQHNIVDTGGRLMNEQQLAELNSALIQGRAHTAEAKARLERVQQILNNGDPDPASSAAATVTDTLHNDVITKLRQQYLDLGAKESDWSTRYGPKHLAVINLRNQMQEIRRSIRDELRRIAETYKSEYEIAKSREESMQNSLAQIVSQSQTMNEAQVTLHNLESSAQSFRTLYDNFLQRYMESVQQQSFPITEARLITQATPPQGKSAPRSTMVLILAAMSGIVLGIGIGMFREISDQVFRTTAQVEERLHVDCIALLPLVKGATRAVPATRPAANAGSTAPRIISRQEKLLWTMAEQPFSRFAESIRSLKVAADLNNGAKPSKVVGITSSLPNEGKSTVAMALAQLICLGGARAILIDCDLRNPSLSRRLAPKANSGVLDVLWGKVPLEQAVWTEPATALAFIPAVVRSPLAHSSDILASDETRRLFDRLREAYDYVIVDLSPLAPVVDVRAMTHLVDSFVFVVEWGRTRIQIAEQALGGARGVYENLLGVVLNKVDMNKLGRYENQRADYYHSRYYAGYGHTD